MTVSYTGTSENKLYCVQIARINNSFYLIAVKYTSLFVFSKHQRVPCSRLSWSHTPIIIIIIIIKLASRQL